MCCLQQWVFCSVTSKVTLIVPTMLRLPFKCFGGVVQFLHQYFRFLSFCPLKKGFNSCHHVTAKGPVSQIMHSNTRLKQLIFVCSVNCQTCSFTLCLVAACSVHSRAAKTRSPCRECYVCGQRSPLCPILENGSSGESQLRSYQGFFPPIFFCLFVCFN